MQSTPMQHKRRSAHMLLDMSCKSWKSAKTSYTEVKEGKRQELPAGLQFTIQLANAGSIGPGFQSAAVVVCPYEGDDGGPNGDGAVTVCSPLQPCHEHMLDATLLAAFGDSPFLVLL
jgi:hypothetical protein